MIISLFESCQTFSVGLNGANARRVRRATQIAISKITGSRSNSRRRGCDWSTTPTRRSAMRTRRKKSTTEPAYRPDCPADYLVRKVQASGDIVMLLSQVVGNPLRIEGKTAKHAKPTSRCYAIASRSHPLHLSVLFTMQSLRLLAQQGANSEVNQGSTRTRWSWVPSFSYSDSSSDCGVSTNSPKAFRATNTATELKEAWESCWRLFASSLESVAAALRCTRGPSGKASKASTSGSALVTNCSLAAG